MNAFYRIILFISSVCLTVSCSENTEERTLRIIFLGDTYFGESYQENRGDESILRQKGYEYSISNYKNILSEADFICCNLEAPITTAVDSPLKGREKYLHRADPVTAQILKKYGIDYVSVGNNHSMDYGVKGLYDTFKHLGSAGIGVIGAGKTERDAYNPVIRRFNLSGQLFTIAIYGCFEHSDRYEKDGFYAKDNMSGCCRLDIPRLAGEIGSLRKVIADVFIVIFPHWGINYKWKTARQQVFARRLIDAGADMVIGHGSHMIGEIETYKEKLIVYSIGNFVFNSPGRYSSYDAPPYSYIAVLEVVVDNEGRLDSALKLYPILTDNAKTGYRGRFVDIDEGRHVYEVVMKKSVLGNNNLRPGLLEDSHGPYIRFPVKLR